MSVKSRSLPTSTVLEDILTSLGIEASLTGSIFVYAFAQGRQFKVILALGSTQSGREVGSLSALTEIAFKPSLLWG